MLKFVQRASKIWLKGYQGQIKNPNQKTRLQEVTGFRSVIPSATHDSLPAVRY